MAKSALPMLTLVNTVFQVLLTAPLAKFSGKSVQNRNSLLMVGAGVFALGRMLCRPLETERRRSHRK